MSNYRTWDELTRVEQLQCMFSDTWKDVYGCRPRHMTVEQWNDEQWLGKSLDEIREISQEKS